MSAFGEERTLELRDQKQIQWPLTATGRRSQNSIVVRFSVSLNLKGEVNDLRSTELPLSMPTSNSSKIEQIPGTTLSMVPGSTD